MARRSSSTPSASKGACSPRRKLSDAKAADELFNKAETKEDPSFFDDDRRAEAVYRRAEAKKVRSTQQLAVA
jgi:hypothetical protein